MRRLALCLLGLSLGLGVLACATRPPPPPHGYRDGALYLALARAHLDRVNCPQKDCERWFKTDLHEKGDLRVDVTARSQGGRSAQYSVLLLDGRAALDARSAPVIARESSLGELNVRLAREVPASSYLVGIVSRESGAAFDFSVMLGFDPAPPALALPELPPPPEFETHTSAVLETEGYGQDTRAVLIGSGAQQGMAVGLRGRLVDAGAEIGKVVIEQVYPDGSRALIEGSLLKPVTHQTMAEIEVPVGVRAEDNDSTRWLFDDPNEPPDEEGYEEQP